MGINCPGIVTLSRKLGENGIYSGDYPVDLMFIQAFSSTVYYCSAVV